MPEAAEGVGEAVRAVGVLYVAAVAHLEAVLLMVAAPGSEVRLRPMAHMSRTH